MTLIEQIDSVATRHEFKKTGVAQWERPTRFGTPKRFGTKFPANIVIAVHDEVISMQLEGETSFGDITILISNIKPEYMLNRVRELEMKLAYSWAELN